VETVEDSDFDDVVRAPPPPEDAFGTRFPRTQNPLLARMSNARSFDFTKFTRSRDARRGATRETSPTCHAIRPVRAVVTHAEPGVTDPRFTDRASPPALSNRIESKTKKKQDPESTAVAVVESVTPEPAVFGVDAPDTLDANADVHMEGEAVMESTTPEPAVASPEPDADADADHADLADPADGEEDPNALDAVPEGGDYDAMRDMAAASEESAASRLAQLQMQVEAQHQQLEVESKTNAELEDMLLRIEKHFKAEQVARRTAETKASSAETQILEERELREKAQLELKNRMHEGERNAQLKAALAAERGALEAEKNKVEAEIEEARGDAQRSAEALARAEEAIRQEETVARLKLESEHNAKVSRLAVEIDRLKEELEQRTNAMGNEMMRWKSQADAAANAVSLAKDEVMERKKELDSTKEKMDHLVEKLYIGREKGLELRGAIDFHLERHRTNFGSGRHDAAAVTASRKKPIANAKPSAPALGAPAPSKRGARNAREAPRKMDTANRALQEDMYGSRDINAPGGRAPAEGGYARARGGRDAGMRR